MRAPAEAQGAERPDQLLERVADTLEALLAARVELSWADVDALPPVPSAAHHVRVEVYQQDVPYATLDVLSTKPYSECASFALGQLGALLTAQVDALTLRRMRAVMREFRMAMDSGSDMHAVSYSAASIAVEHMDAEAAMLLLMTGKGVRSLAAVGEWSDEPALTAQLTEVARLGLEALGPMQHADSLVSVPIASSRPARCVLIIRFSPQAQVHSLTFPVLSEMANVAAPFLDARWRDRVFTELLELNSASEETTTAEMYSRVLATALRLVPGADSGTLLTRTSPDAPFIFQAAVGFDIDMLATQPIDEAAARAWYGAEDDGWLKGVPRILSGVSTNIDEIGSSTTPNIDPAARLYDQIKATLCLPVLRDGVVMAVLNLDNLEEAGRFGPDSAQLAYLFGAPLASLLHRQNTRDVLRRAALTDELTGLANRRAFNEALTRELQRAKRAGPGPSVLHMDLKRFKAINDAYGHDVGDSVLVAVADAIRANIRTIDVAARYGGDEFISLLLDTPNKGALNVADRIRAAVAQLDVGLGPTRIDIGVASYETDGADSGSLIRLADERMYEAKRS